MVLVTRTQPFSRLLDPLGGVFYLHGEDQFRKEEAVRAIVEAHLEPGTRDFNLDTLRGTELDAETLASVIATPPMMAEWRVVVVREMEGLVGSKHARDVLSRALASPPPGLALVLSCTAPQGSKAKLYGDLARRARSLELEAVTDADVPGWLMSRASESHGVELEVEAARALGTAIGVDLGVLARELEKLTTFVGERRRITVADVGAAGTKLPAQDRWRWFDMVGERRFEEAADAIEILLAQGETGVGLVIGLATHLLRLGIVSGGGQRALEEELPPHQRWLARRVAGQARHWSPEEVDRALTDLRDVDQLMKASSHAPEHFLEGWLLGLRVRMRAA